MKTLLIPLDGSALAEQALPYAQPLAQALGARIRLLHVVTEIDAHNPLAYDISTLYAMGEVVAAQQQRYRESWDTIREYAQGYLASQAIRLKDEGFDVEFDVRFGSAPETIVEVAEQQAALVLMATHGYSGLRRWALGSVTDRVVQSASTPVLVVRGGSPAPAKPVLKRVLTPLDGSPFAQQALPLAVELATCAGAELELLRALPPLTEANPAYPLDRAEMAENNLDVKREYARVELGEHAATLGAADLAITTVVATGHAAEVIVDEAARRQIDLIVMATHGRGGVRRWALGSVADKVLHATTTPLLLVRAKE
jgi:nucleotide-binding universal stress UspA family protein